jgi:hypothetical protein
VALVDHDALSTTGDAGRAVVRVPEPATGGVAVYCCWMLRSEQYEEFAQVLAQRNIVLRTIQGLALQGCNAPGTGRQAAGPGCGTHRPGADESAVHTQPLGTADGVDVPARSGR